MDEDVEQVDPIDKAWASLLQGPASEIVVNHLLSIATAPIVSELSKSSPIMLAFYDGQRQLALEIINRAGIRLTMERTIENGQ